jgi:anaerobic selenocysteine-containing dehydrogenase
MSKWHKTGCVLCAQNCGLEVLVEDNRMVKVRTRIMHAARAMRAAKVST